MSPPAALQPPLAPAVPSVVALPTLEASNLAVTNPANLSIDILPGPHIRVGSRVSFRISAKRPGYLILLDVDSSGKPRMEFVATPPLGVAMVVAVLSDQPVQIVDLPDIPMSIVGQAESLAFLSKLATELRVPVSGSETRLQQPRWSFDAKFYQIAQAAN
jgi:hypothetical protein